MVRTQLELLPLPPGRLLLERVQHTFVEGATALAQQALVGDFERQSVSEGELGIGKERPLVEKLGCLQTSELATKLLIGVLGDRLEQRERHFVSDDCCSLKKPLVFGREPVDPPGQHRLYRRRHLDRLNRPGQAIAAGLASERLGLDKGPNTLLQEEGVAIGLLDEALLEGLERGVVPEESLEKFFGTLRRQGIKP